MQTSAVEGASAASPGQIPIALPPQQAHALGQPRRRRCGRMLPLRKRRNRLRPAPKMGAWKDHLAMTAERSSAAAAASEGLRCLRAEAADDGDVGGSRAPVDEDIGCLLPDAQKEDTLGAGARHCSGRVEGRRALTSAAANSSVVEARQLGGRETSVWTVSLTVRRAPGRPLGRASKCHRGITTEKKFILFDRDLRVWHIIS